MPSNTPNVPAIKNALADVQPALDLITSDRIEDIRLDVLNAAILGISTAARAKPYQEAVRAQLGESFAAPFDHLDDAARALLGAQADHLVERHGHGLADLIAELSDKRAILDLEGQSLVQKKRMASSRFAELVGGTGYRAMAMDVLQLVAAFRKEWAAVEAHTPVTLLELDESEALANTLITTLGENGAVESGSSPSAELRGRAYTYFVQTYDDVRRAITYLRWYVGDADEIAPSLSSGRNRRSSRDEETATPASPTPAAPPVPPGMPGAPPFTQ